MFLNLGDWKISNYGGVSWMPPSVLAGGIPSTRCSFPTCVIFRGTPVLGSSSLTQWRKIDPPAPQPTLQPDPSEPQLSPTIWLQDLLSADPSSLTCDPSPYCGHINSHPQVLSETCLLLPNSALSSHVSTAHTRGPGSLTRGRWASSSQLPQLWGLSSIVPLAPPMVTVSSMSPTRHRAPSGRVSLILHCVPGV